MNAVQPESQLAYEALMLANQARRAARLLETVPSNHPRIPLPFGALDGRNFGRESAFLRLMSIVEAYLDAASINWLRGGVPEINPTVTRLLNEYEINGSRSWQAREDQYSNYLDLQLSATSPWPVITAARDVRNCLAHGQGRLTANLRQKKNLSRSVQVLHVSISDKRMQLASKTVPTLGGSIRQFILEVDSKIPQH